MTWESEMEENVDSVQDLILMSAPQRQSQIVSRFSLTALTSDRIN
jgi:hypothetical protein